jgi:hypothetical protein
MDDPPVPPPFESLSGAFDGLSPGKSLVRFNSSSSSKRRAEWSKMGPLARRYQGIFAMHAEGL